MSLTKTIQEVHELLPQFISNVSGTSRLPDFATAEYKYLVPLVGTALYNDIHTKYNAIPSTLSDDEKILAKRMGLVAVAYAYKDGLALGHITLTDNGARKFSPNGTTTVYKWEFDELKQTLLSVAYDATEVLINYLVEKQPALWTASEEYKKVNSLLIKSGTDFNEQYNTYQPIRTFWNIRSVIADVQEMHLQEALGVDLLQYFIDQAAPAGELAGIIKKLKKATAFFTIKQCCLQYTVRFSDQGFTILSGEGDKDSAEHTARQSADAELLQLKMENCESMGQDYLQKAKEAAVSFYANAAAPAAYKTAFDKSPLVSYINKTETPSLNEGLKGMYVL